MTAPPPRVDVVDLRVVQELVREPRLSVSELAERVGVARNTAQARLDRLVAAGVLGRNDRGVDLRGLGFTVSAIVAIEVRHVEIDRTVEALERNPSVLLVEEVAGARGDLLVRVVARSTDHLQEVVHSLLSSPGVERTVTSVVLSTRVPYRTGPLLAALEGELGG